MPHKDPRVDAYIAKSADFARPILNHLRRIVHAAWPEMEETMKWNCPHFIYKGIVCNMAAFKQHCTFGFWKSSLIFDKGKKSADTEAMGQFGRLTAVSDLPGARTLADYVRKAARLNADGIKLPPRSRAARRAELAVPADLTAALKRNGKARRAFEDFSYSHKKEYVEWITEAKREETRQRRLATAIQWLAGGKSRHWKYASC